jgi:hypothetical protein
MVRVWKRISLITKWREEVNRREAQLSGYRQGRR